MTRRTTDHGIHWIGAIPSAWKLVTLKSLISIQNGDWGSDPVEIGQSGSVLTCYRKADFTQTGTVVSGETLRRLARKPFVRQLDILLEKSGGGDVTPVGAVAIVTACAPAACSNFLARLRAKESRVEPRFIWRFLSAVHASRQIWSLFKQTTGIQNIDMGALAALEVPFPDFLEQRRIVDWLDIQTTRIDKRRELLAKKRGLLRGLRSNLIGETLAYGLHEKEVTLTGLVDLPTLPVGWQASHIKRLLRFITSGSRGWAEYYADVGDIFLRIGNLTRETIDLDLSDMKYVALPAKAAEGKRTRLRPGDMLVSITADLGSIAVVPVLEKPAYVSQHIALCRPKVGVNPRWLGYAMVSPQAKRQLMNSGYGGTKIQLSLDDVRNVWVAVPPLDEQIEIADFLDRRLSKLARQIALIDRLDNLLKQQRKALIHEAVTGKIDLSNYEPPAA